MKALVLFAILCGATPQLSAQESHFGNNLLGVKFGLGLSPATSVFQEPHLNSEGERTGYGLSSSPSPGIHGKVSYALQVRPNTFIELGILVGNESVKYTVRGGQDFFSHDWNVFPLKMTEFEMEYFGLSLQLQHHHSISDRIGLFGGIGVSGVHYVPWSSWKLYTVKKNSESIVIFRDYFQVNGNEKNFYKLDIDLGFYQKIGKFFLLKPSISYSYSRNTLLESIDPYVVVGDRETITGTVSRKVRHFGLNVGFYINF